MTTFVLPRPSALSRRTVVGIAAVAAVVCLWSSFALSTRALEATGMGIGDAAIVRFGVPAVLLAPWIPRTLRRLRGEPATVTALVLLAGLPHFLLFAWGAHLTSAALTGLLVPGTVPLFVTILLFLHRRTTVSRTRLIALAAIVAGVAASTILIGGIVDAGGIAVLLAAGLVWAAYTIGLARTRLDPVGVIAVVSVASLLAALALAATGAMPSQAFQGNVDFPAWAAYALVQGVGTGLLSTACYVVAVKNLGSSIPAAAGALSPVLTALVAVPLLGEPLSAGLVVALVLITCGVAAFALAPARTASRPMASDPASAPNR
ncbi:DMT family transporter [Microbacterium sp. KSW2-29]|uniref:DMT family transporter n=1 Tax=Microbacterium phycohabitans TaxID=3075993 RepID=A0ABU3SNP0_9MICO|nr:DMT family transporter [Microbacterium sp. KSW2-29]MDU0346456.1 DMT family transporter [Microbacterium sp. KSW2-29]